MRGVALSVGAILILLVLWDAFETLVLPRTVRRPFRLTTFYYRYARRVLRLLVHWTKKDSPLHATILNAYGPLSLLMLFSCWATCLILGFALVHWATWGHSGEGTTFLATLYFSGVTFLTLGFGDITPKDALGRIASVFEAGVGFGFLAIIISYLPVLYQSFSRREVGICLLDARAGSPPTAAELLWRYGHLANLEALTEVLREWEVWSAELLESHLSFPILAFYRSQHDQQSWLGALTAILDACALLSLDWEGEVHGKKALRWQAHLTYAMARHALIDLSLILYIDPVQIEHDRLPPEEWERLYAQIRSAGFHLRQDSESARMRLERIRLQYEPYVYGLAERLYIDVPPWVAPDGTRDNWQTSAWDSIRHF